jgi:hypothetical protein
MAEPKRGSVAAFKAAEERRKARLKNRLHQNQTLEKKHSIKKLHQ